MGHDLDDEELRYTKMNNKCDCLKNYIHKEEIKKILDRTDVANYKELVKSVLEIRRLIID